MDKNFDKTATDILKTDGIQSKGFGIVPKLVMQDKRLTIQAKAIYAYFCSYAGNGTTAFPSRSKILFDLGISKDTYYKHFNLLKQYGYIKVEQQHQGGRLSRNVYTLMQVVPVTEESTSCKSAPAFSPTPKAEPAAVPTLDPRDAADQCPNFSDAAQSPEIQCPEKQCPKPSDTNNNTRIQYKQYYYNQSSQSMSMTDQTDRNETVTVDTVDNYVNLIKENIEYDFLKAHRIVDEGMLDEVVFVILDVLFTESRTIRINGQEKHREVVKSVLLKLDSLDITEVLDKYKSLAYRISNAQGYLLSMLYNHKLENHTKIQNQVICDMYGYA